MVNFFRFTVDWKWKKILMLLDNFSGHVVDVNQFKMITFSYLPPNTTSQLQPLDAGIIRSFKAKYVDKLLTRIGENLNQNNSVKEATKKINLFDAVNWIDLSWKEVSSDCIVNCWRKSEGKIQINQNVESMNSFEITNLTNNLNSLSIQHQNVTFCNTNEYLKSINDNIDTLTFN